MSDISVVYEDEWLVAVNKPAGLLVHANPGRPEENLQDLLSEARGRRLILFHRLDKETSGLVLLGKRPEINEGMTKLFEEKKIRKLYFAVVDGEWSKTVNRVESRLARGAEGRMVESPAGKVALTTFRIRSFSERRDKTWLEVLPKTGRTHQIRVHCAAVGHPVLGDRLYGERGPAGLALHARQADFRHPLTGSDVRIVTDIPHSWNETFLNGFNLEGKRRPC